MADGHEQVQAAGKEQLAQGAYWQPRSGHEVVVWKLQSSALQQPQANMQVLWCTARAAGDGPRSSSKESQGRDAVHREDNAGQQSGGQTLAEERHHPQHHEFGGVLKPRAANEPQT